MSNPNPNPANSLRLVAYLRVSTQGQAIQGDSIPAQEEACRAWAEQHGHEVVLVEADEGLSGTLSAEDRPGLTSALLAITDGGADGLVIRDLDRIARKLHVQEAVLGHVWASGGRVFDLSGEILQDDPDDPMRTFLRQVRGAAAQLEAGVIRTRLRDGRKRRARAGHYIGGFQRKYGFRLVPGDGGRHDWEPVEAEQEVIERIKELRRTPGQTLRSIAAALEGEGIASPSGGERWHEMTLSRIARQAVAA
jgi:DNA invertase Pin-like site-specific DNA recombinase